MGGLRLQRPTKKWPTSSGQGEHTIRHPNTTSSFLRRQVKLEVSARDNENTSAGNPPLENRSHSATIDLRNHGTPSEEPTPLPIQDSSSDSDDTSKPLDVHLRDHGPNKQVTGGLCRNNSQKLVDSGSPESLEQKRGVFGHWRIALKGIFRSVMIVFVVFVFLGGLLHMLDTLVHQMTVPDVPWQSQVLLEAADQLGAALQSLTGAGLAELDIVRSPLSKGRRVFTECLQLSSQLRFHLREDLGDCIKRGRASGVWTECSPTIERARGTARETLQCFDGVLLSLNTSYNLSTNTQGDIEREIKASSSRLIDDLIHPVDKEKQRRRQQLKRTSLPSLRQSTGHERNASALISMTIPRMEALDHALCFLQKGVGADLAHGADVNDHAKATATSAWMIISNRFWDAIKTIVEDEQDMEKFQEVYNLPL